MTKRMIYHHPLPLTENATSASGIRPMQMKHAFEKLGYEVWDVTGFTKERSRKAAAVHRALRNGSRFDFCYSESSTMPMSMTNPTHLPTRPFLDLSLFRGLRRRGVPVGHFLRDIYWRFPDYRRSVSFPKREAALLAYQWDMWVLRHQVDHVFLPSPEMAEHVNLGRTPFSALPPGHDYPEPLEGPTSGLSIFYVGGIGAHYRMHQLVAGVKKASSEGINVRLTLCVRPDDWKAVKHEYAQQACPAIRVVHAQGPGLREHFLEANIASLLVEPTDYWRLAVPVKLFEYIGAGKPILAAKGTLTGKKVEEESLGWVIDNTSDSLVELLRRLEHDPGEMERMRRTLLAHREEHSWENRARQVAATLRRRDTDDPPGATAERMGGSLR